MPLQNNGMRQRTASGIQRNLPCREKLAERKKKYIENLRNYLYNNNVCTGENDNKENRSW